MGKVYLAKDVKLDRQVEIKVLPDSLTRDKERVARFEREAKLLASLNHLNIAAIHGFDEWNGTRFLVLEYVEGKTLSRRVKAGAVPVDEALDVARQIAEALERAYGDRLPPETMFQNGSTPGNRFVSPICGNGHDLSFPSSQDIQ